MRTIEKKIIETFMECINDADSTNKTFNLTRRDTVTMSKYSVSYELWGSYLFWLDCETKSFYFSFCKYSTNTTKNRLNAFFQHFTCSGFYQKNWDIFWTRNDNSKVTKIDTSKTYKIIVSAGVVDIEAVN